MSLAANAAATNQNVSAQGFGLAHLPFSGRFVYRLQRPPLHDASAVIQD